MTIRGPLSTRLSNTTTALTSGAARVGVAAITGLAGGSPTNVQAALADIITQLSTKIGASLGLPPGGTTGQILKKSSGADYAVSWSSEAAASDASTATKGLTKLSSTPASSINPIAVGDNDARMSPAAPGTASVRTLGTTSTSALAGNDSRLSEGAAGTATVRTLSTTSTSACAGNDLRLTRYDRFRFFLSGDIDAKNGVGHDPVDVACTVDKLQVSCDTAPSGGTLTATFKREAGGPGGTTTTIGSVTLSAASRFGVVTSGLTGTLADGDTVRVDITTGAGYTPASAKNLTAKARASY